MAYNNSKQKLISETLRKKKSKQEEERVGWAQDQRLGRTKKKKTEMCKGRSGDQAQAEVEGWTGGQICGAGAGRHDWGGEGGQHDWEAT
jgi:hypothetical protein